MPYAPIAGRSHEVYYERQRPHCGYPLISVSVDRMTSMVVTPKGCIDPKIFPPPSPAGGWGRYRSLSKGI